MNDVITTTQNQMQEASDKRLEKYIERVQKKPKCRNQLLIKNGQGFFVKNGEPHRCNKIEGYIQLPNMKCLEPIQQMDIGIYFVPQKRIIILSDGQVFYRGYRQFNAPNCTIFLHAVTQYYDLLVVDVADDITALVAIDDAEVDNVNARTFEILDYLVKNPNSSLSIAEPDKMEGDTNEDDWE